MSTGERQARYNLDERTRKLINDRSWPRTGPGRYSPSRTMRRIVDRYAAMVRHYKPDLEGLMWEELAMKVTTPFDSAAVIEQLDRVLRNDLESLLDEQRLEKLCATVAAWSFAERVAAVDEIERCRLKTFMPVLGERAPASVDKKE
jgi:hypothetical protein